jgi:hypothetical protein
MGVQRETLGTTEIQQQHKDSGLKQLLHPASKKAFNKNVRQTHRLEATKQKLSFASACRK